MQDEIISLIKKEYETTQNDWYLGYSGGKDSTALLIMVLNAIRTTCVNEKCNLHVVYCDTGVEFPIVANMVKMQFNNLSEELECKNQNSIDFQIVNPALEDRFFSMVIGNGYVPPTFMFRWCTRRLRIKPIQRLLNINEDKASVLLGVRKGESVTRDRVIDIHRTGNYYTKQKGYPNTSIFCPIINFSVDDVWDTITNSKYPQKISRQEICELYRILGTKFSLDGKYICDEEQGRYGCWTCTTVRKDKAMQCLIQNGYSSLIPLNDFMTWLKEIRNDGKLRDANRITGEVGKGPFNLNTRKVILGRLLIAQEQSNMQLISTEEIEYIKKQWLFYCVD